MQTKKRQFLPLRAPLFRLGLYLLALALIGGSALLGWQIWREAERGIFYGLPPEIRHASPPRPLGVNLDLAAHDRSEWDRLLVDVERAEMGWVRQRFPWAKIEPQPGEYQWVLWDEILAAIRKHDLALIALLDTSPPWARDGGSDAAPPKDFRDFGRFARAFAARYSHEVDYYQIWDEPNLSERWGGGYVDPAAYTAMLREGFTQVKSTDQKSFILTAGLAPTTEKGPLNLNEVDFLRGMYAAGAGDFFDILAAKPYGFWSGPEDRRVDMDVLNFSRLILLREEMERQGDGDSAIWAVEFGWNALPQPWEGKPSPWGTDEEEKQAQRTVEAISRARDEWPWLGVMALAALTPPADPDDPRAGFSLLDGEGNPRLLYRLLPEVTRPVTHVGRYQADYYAARYEGKWRITPFGADIGGSGDSLIIPFKGTRLDLFVRRGDFWGLLYVTVDGKPAQNLPRDEEGRAYLILRDPLRRPAWITLASGLPDGEHEARLLAEGGWGQWAILGWAVSREQQISTAHFLFPLLGLAFLFFLWRVIRLWPQVRRTLGSASYLQPQMYARLGEGPAFALTALAGALFYFSPNLPLTLAGLVLLALLIYLRLETGLVLAAFSIPFFLQTKALAGKQFSMVEVVVMLCLLAWALRGEWRLEVGSRAMSEIWGVAFFVALSALSLLWAENKGVAGRELRVVIIEPALFYFLLASSRLDERGLRRVVEALILGAVAVAGLGLYQYFFAVDITATEGVRRVRGVYGSPNNLSLFLGRILPLLFALIAFDRSLRRRALYGLACVPIALCLYLTYSRGAWFLGLPASLVFIGLMRGGRATWGALGAAVAAVALLLLPLLGTERITSTLNAQEGTTFLRMKLWQGALNMIRDHPLLGVGLDNFLYQYRTRYILPSAWPEPELSHPHNIILDWWTRLGVGGMVAFLWLEIAFFKKGLALYRRLEGEAAQALVLGLMGSMVSGLVHGLIDNSFFLVDLAFVFFLTFGVMAKLEEALRGQKPASLPASTVFPTSG